MKQLKLTIKIVLFVIGIIVLIPVMLIVYESIFGYKPAESENSLCLQQTAINQLNKDTITILNWNIGYAGLGSEMDFFYDGGTKSYTTKSLTETHLEKIISFTKKSDADFILLQEVDIASNRSHKINETEEIANALPNYSAFFACNYKVSFVPLPIYKPTGSVESGILTLSKFQAESSVRYSFPGNYDFPMNLFMLDRCFMVNEYPQKNGKTLYLINTHNSAFDDGTLRKEQLLMLKNSMLQHYSEGDYVIVCGDWNVNPVGFENNRITDEPIEIIKPEMSENWLPRDWNFATDLITPTNRSLETNYIKGKSNVTIIDFAVTSPNVEIITTTTAHLGFEDSDHNPIMFTFVLKNR